MNCKMVEVWRSSSPTPLVKKCHLECRLVSETPQEKKKSFMPRPSMRLRQYCISELGAGKTNNVDLQV